MSGRRFAQQIQLALTGIPQFVGRPLEREREDGNRNRRKGGYRAAHFVQELRGLQHDEGQKLVRGATRELGVSSWLAKLAVVGDKLEDQQQHQQRSDEQPNYLCALRQVESPQLFRNATPYETIAATPRCAFCRCLGS